MLCHEELGREGGGKEGHSKTLRAVMKKGVGFPFLNSEFTGPPLCVSGHLRIGLNNSIHCAVDV